MEHSCADSFSHDAREEISHRNFAPCCGRALLASLKESARFYKSHGLAVRLKSASAARLAISLLKIEAQSFSWKKLNSSYIISFSEPWPDSGAANYGQCCRRAWLAG